MFNKIIQFSEPHLTGGVCTVTLTEAQAITAQRLYQIASKRYPLDGDNSLLLEFMTVHWATYVEDTQ